MNDGIPVLNNEIMAVPLASYRSIGQNFLHYIRIPSLELLPGVKVIEHNQKQERLTTPKTTEETVKPLKNYVIVWSVQTTQCKQPCPDPIVQGGLDNGLCCYH